MDAGSTLALALLISVVAGGILLISMMSVARAVALHKHPDWAFNAAFNYVYARGIAGLAVTAAIVAAIWFVPEWIPGMSANKTVRPWQAMATVFVIIVDNLHYYFSVIEKIRRPPT
jgi:hypothetical protein